MASLKLCETRDGRRFYEIHVSRGRGKSAYQTRYYPPESWSATTAEREAWRVAAAFELKCKAGEVMNRAQEREKKETARKEAEKLKTFEQYSTQVYIPQKQATLSPRTCWSYRWQLEKYLLPVFGDKLITEISPVMIQRFLVDFQSKGFAFSSIKRVYFLLHSIFGDAFFAGAIPENPMARIKPPKRRKDEVRQDEAEKSLTIEEIQIIRQYLQNQPLKWRVLFAVLLDTGCRRGEAVGLTWPDIDFQNGTVLISKNVQYTPERGVFVTTPKTGRARTVDIGPETLALLRALREEQSTSCISQFVFTKDNSPEPMHPDTPTRIIHKIGQRCGISRLHTHLTRHTSASLAITGGADILSVGRRLGHSDISTTLRVYSHANAESIRRAGQIVRDAIQTQDAT